MDPFNERYRLFARHLVRGECCDDEDGRYCEQGLALLESWRNADRDVLAAEEELRAAEEAEYDEFSAV